ncbi:MAG: hypothetical protein PHE53_00375, partial [Thermoguttaceae bacterium]|nr:hypothetical protein [Thermoguttaceae bacterium]
MRKSLWCLLAATGIVVCCWVATSVASGNATANAEDATATDAADVEDLFSENADEATDETADVGDTDASITDEATDAADPFAAGADEATDGTTDAAEASADAGASDEVVDEDLFGQGEEIETDVPVEITAVEETEAAPVAETTPAVEAAPVAE